MFLLRTSFAAAVLAVSLLGGPSHSDSQPASAPLRVKPAATSAANAALNPLPSRSSTQRRVSHRSSSATSPNKYRYLDGVTVSLGQTPNGEEAVAYYTIGQILIDSDHTVTTQKILSHEIWHVIDWRDNGKIDWGEDLPPSNSADYLSR